MPCAVTKSSQFEAESEIGGKVTNGGGFFRNETLGAGRWLDLLSIARIEYLETVPGKEGATMEETSAVDLFLEGNVLSLGSTTHPKYNIDFHEMIRSAEVGESETKTARVMEDEGEINKVKTISNKKLRGLPIAEDNEYFSGFTSCQARFREEARATGNTSATDSLSERMVISPFAVPSCMTFPNTLGVGDKAATSPWMVLTAS